MPLQINSLGDLCSKLYMSLPTDGVWRNVSKIAGVIFLCMVGAVAKWGWYGAQKEGVDVYVSMAGNPAHMGHMEMIGLAVKRLVKEGYQIHQVKVALSSEEYLRTKVIYSNH